MSAYSEINIILARAADNTRLSVDEKEDKKKIERSVDSTLIHPDDKKIGDECTCGVCGRIYPNFLACSICTYRLCISCRNKWPDKCPGCRQISSFDPQHPKFDFRVKCEYSECKEYITLGIQHATYYRHMSECKYSIEECKQCKKQIRKYEREEHYKDHLPVRCEYCHTFVTRSELKVHQTRDKDLLCKGWMYCPNECYQYTEDALSLVVSHPISEGKRIKILCSNLEKHLQMCQNRFVKCKVCRIVLPNSQLKIHLREHSFDLMTNFLRDEITNQSRIQNIPSNEPDSGGKQNIEIRLYRNDENYGVKCHHDYSGIVPFFRTLAVLDQHGTIDIDSFRPDHIDSFHEIISRPMLFFPMIERNNKTYRIGKNYQVVTSTHKNFLIHQIKPSNKQYSFWVIPYDDVVITGSDCLLFLKYVNPSGDIIFAGMEMFNRSQPISTVQKWYSDNYPSECNNGTIIEEEDSFNNKMVRHDIKSSFDDRKICTGDIFTWVPDKKTINYNHNIVVNFYPDPSLGIMDIRLHTQVLVDVKDTVNDIINKLRLQLNLNFRDNLYLYPMTPIDKDGKFIQSFEKMICLSSGIPYMTTSLMRNSMMAQYRYPLVASYFSWKKNIHYKLARFIVPKQPLGQVINTLPFQPDQIFVNRRGIIIDKYDINSKTISQIPYLRSEVYSNDLDAARYQFLDVDSKIECFYYPVQLIDSRYKIAGDPDAKTRSSSDKKVIYARGTMNFKTGEIKIGSYQTEPVKIPINESKNSGSFSAILIPSDWKLSDDSKASSTSSLSSSSVPSTLSASNTCELDIENISIITGCSLYIAKQAYNLTDQSKEDAIKLVLSGALSN